MRRLNRQFYAELEDVRDQFGRTEYERGQILPAVIGLLRSHLDDENELWRDAATGILDSVEKAEDAIDPRQEELFNLHAHIALGDGRRIKRGRMNTEQCRRRKRVIDNNKVAQDQSWARETGWLNTQIDKLEGRPLETVIEDVMPPASVKTGTSAAHA